MSVLLIHAVLLPLLFYGLLTVVRNVQEDVFIDHVRIYSRTFADLLQTNDVLASEAEYLASLDSSILGGRCVHAALRVGGRRILSSLMDAEDGDRFNEDFRFGEHEDNVYYLATSLQLGTEPAVLELGFDEEPTLLEIESAGWTILYILVTYLLVTLVLVFGLSILLSRPLQRLRYDSRKIASGDYKKRMSVDSGIFEIRELTHDLEHMRSTLVGINARLKAEIVSREEAEAERRKAEVHMRNMDRLQSIGTLAGGVAHEFNNVLLPLLLYTDLALEDLPQDSEIRPNLERVMKLANRAKRLSEKILTFSRPSGDALKITSDIAPVVEEGMSMIRALIPANIDIKLSVERPAGPILCDPSELQQLLVNLCGNAYQALAAGGGTIDVDLRNCSVTESLRSKHPELGEENYVRLRVVDTGEGMSSATIDRIFEPFYTTREVGKGTGLGLSVVHGIVAKHNGEIVVTSEIGAGTTIDVYFPQCKNQDLTASERQ